MNQISLILRRLTLLCFVLICCAFTLKAQPYVPVPTSLIYSSHFEVRVGGKPMQVMHAAQNLYFVNMTAGKHRHITVTAPEDGFWASGVEIQPWRLNIRPVVAGRVLTFTVSGVAQLTISRPNDFGSNAEMLYLFADPPEVHPPAATLPGVRYYPAGVYQTNIDAHSGDTLYLAPGAVIFGSLNLWRVHDVKVFGRGILVYDGPQNPADDDGWMHKPNWHCIVMDKAQDISIEGITCVVRSRTWQIQMAQSHRIVFDNIKVIGANAGNANADGMDWLGGGDTVVRNSFFRAADDIFAMQSGWNGYTEEALADQGQPVNNIVVENTVLSTSISNIVRAAWPKKNFEGGGFTLRNADVLHMGMGGCGVPFALLGMWADPGGRGQNGDFQFEDIRLEDWYTLFQLLQPAPGIKGVSFRDVMALEQPAHVPSVSSGEVSGVSLDNVIADGDILRGLSDLPADALDGAPPPTVTDTAPLIDLKAVTGLVRPGQKIHFEAASRSGEEKGLHYTWLFGDGKQAAGRRVSHRFPDTAGTLQDNSGRFRVLLHVSSDAGRNVWLYQPVVVTHHLLASISSAAVPQTFTVSAQSVESPGTVLDVDVQVPVDGSYVFLLIANDHATMTLDGQVTAHSPAPIAQVCGLAGNAAQLVTLPAALSRGLHHIRVSGHYGEGRNDLKLLWQGPGFGARRLFPAPSVESGEALRP